MERNPNHGVTNEMRDQYHKLLAFCVWKFGFRRGTRGGETMQIHSSDLEAFARDNPDGINLVVEPDGHTLTLRIVDDTEGVALARKAGGLPS